jgi:DNA-binding MarR family transcriptional regulator
MSKDRPMKRKSRALPGPSGRYDLERHVPYLLNHAGGLIRMKVAEELGNLSVSHTTWRVLGVLFDTGPLRLVELADKGNFELSTLSRAISNLEAKGLLTEVVGPRTGRRGAVQLTPEGRKLVRLMLPVVSFWEERALAGFTAGERELLIELLHRIRKNVAVPDESAAGVA